MMSERRLCSVITPTWQRHDLLLACIDNVRQQAYRPLEHVIVSDGNDAELRRLIRGSLTQEVTIADGGERVLRQVGVPIQFVELGQHWTGLLRDSYAAAPLAVGQLLARGDYQVWLADDDRMDADHIASLIDLIETEGVDFVYSQIRMWPKSGTPENYGVVGAAPPRHGQIGCPLYRPSLLDLARGPYRTHVGRAGDWEFVERALAGGATWAFLPRATWSHRVD
jgi:glycosyltransferase involved in cell wall biosynthesis